MAKPRPYGTGSLSQRGDGRWQASLEIPSADGKRQRQYVYGQTAREALDKLAKAQAQRDRALPIRDARQSTGQYLADWLENSVRVRRRPGTWRAYERTLRLYLVPALGRIPLQKLAPADVERMLAGLQARGLSPKTREGARACLRAALNQALRWGLVDRNAAALTEAVSVPRYPAPVIEVEDAEKILAAVASDPLGPLLTTLLGLGLRLGEAIALEWGDVDLVQQTATIRRQLVYFCGPAARTRGLSGWLESPLKAGEPRVLHLPGWVEAALRRQKVHQAQQRLAAGPPWKGWPKDLVFTSSVGTPIFEHCVWRTFHRLLDQAGLPPLRNHDLRHACATLHHALGSDLKTIQELLGHSTLATTANIYAHLTASKKREAATRLGAAFQAPDEDMAVTMAVKRRAPRPKTG